MGGEQGCEQGGEQGCEWMGGEQGCEQGCEWMDGWAASGWMKALVPLIELMRVNSCVLVQCWKWESPL